MLTELSKTDPVLAQLGIAAHTKENVDRLVAFIEEGKTYYAGEFREWLVRKLPPVTDGSSDCERVIQKAALTAALAFPKAGFNCMGELKKGGALKFLACVAMDLRKDAAEVVFSEAGLGCAADVHEDLKALIKEYTHHEPSLTQPEVEHMGLTENMFDIGE